MPYYMMANNSDILYPAVPVRDGKGNIGGLEIGLGVVAFMAVSVLILKIYKIIRNKRLGLERDYESSLYAPVDSHIEKELPH